MMNRALSPGGPWGAGVITATACLVLATTLSACGGDNGTAPGGSTFEVVEAFPNLQFGRPLDLQQPGDGTNRLFVVEQGGRIRVFDNSPSAPASTVFLDIRDLVNGAGTEEGLLGLAFHPDFRNNGEYFVYYTVLVNGDRKTRVSRFRADPQRPDTTLAGSMADVITIDQPFSNHNGGQIAFGPDGDLYIGVGDGGSADDPLGNGQNRRTPLGAILRIDVDVLPYRVPPDNPFAGNSVGLREEIFAWGLRNPWRFSFDRITGRLWVGDVGQNAWEEIDVVEKGGNYGWRIMEANGCRPPTHDCNPAGLIPPVWAYAHDGGGRSVTGGYVYRGPALPGLRGAYVYGDFVTGELWALHYAGAGPVWNTLLVDTDLNISSFGLDESGELYICAFDGKIYRFSVLTPGN